MVTGVLIILGVLTACALLAVVGARIGSGMESRAIGAGTTEENMRRGMSASVLGALLGILPFIVFVSVLTYMALTLPDDPAEHGATATAAAAH